MGVVLSVEGRVKMVGWVDGTASRRGRIIGTQKTTVRSRRALWVQLVCVFDWFEGVGLRSCVETGAGRWIHVKPRSSRNKIILEWLIDLEMFIKKFKPFKL